MKFGNIASFDERLLSCYNLTLDRLAVGQDFLVKYSKSEITVSACRLYVITNRKLMDYQTIYTLKRSSTKIHLKNLKTFSLSFTLTFRGFLFGTEKE